MKTPKNDILLKILNKVVGLEDFTAKMFGEIVEIKSKMATKDDLLETKTEIFTHIDGFIKLHDTVNTELAATQSRYERLEARVAKAGI